MGSTMRTFVRCGGKKCATLAYDTECLRCGAPFSKYIGRCSKTYPALVGIDAGRILRLEEGVRLTYSEVDAHDSLWINHFAWRTRLCWLRQFVKSSRKKIQQLRAKLVLRSLKSNTL